MKKILVPIDFSEHSLNALNYGIEIANKLNADLKVIHVRTKKNAYRYNYQDAIEALKDRVEDWLDDIIITNKDKYKVEGKTFNYCIREGNIFQEISNQAKYDDTTLIVAGTHGASGFEDKWLGSNAYRLVYHSTVPVITIGNDGRWNNMKKMLIPVTINNSSRQQVPPAVGFANLFESEIIVLGINDGHFDPLNTRIKSITKQTVKFIEKNTKLQVSSVITKGSDKADIILDFARKNEIDLLIADIFHASRLFKTLTKPFTQDIINKSECPVLSIPTKESLYLPH